MISAFYWFGSSSFTTYKYQYIYVLGCLEWNEKTKKDFVEGFNWKDRVI